MPVKRTVKKPTPKKAASAKAAAPKKTTRAKKAAAPKKAASAKAATAKRTPWETALLKVARAFRAAPSDETWKAFVDVVESDLEGGPSGNRKQAAPSPLRDL